MGKLICLTCCTQKVIVDDATQLRYIVQILLGPIHEVVKNTCISSIDVSTKLDMNGKALPQRAKGDQDDSKISSFGMEQGPTGACNSYVAHDNIVDNSRTWSFQLQ